MALIARFALAVWIALLILPSDLGAWGRTGHRLINRNAIELLPKPLNKFYKKHKRTIVDESVAPDDWKRWDKSEGPRHYIDIDLHEKYPFPSFPMSREKAVERFGKKAVTESGTLPWRIEEFYGLLVKAFRDRNWEDAVQLSAHIGHYIGDLHQPLHNTANHDGQLTGSKGVHQMFEEAMVDAHQKDFILDQSAEIYEIKDILAFAFQATREGYPDVQTILNADLAGRTNGRKRAPVYLRTLYRDSGEVARRRIQAASVALASVWHQAWVNAGRPELK